MNKPAVRRCSPFGRHEQNHVDVLPLQKLLLLPCRSVFIPYEQLNFVCGIFFNDLCDIAFKTDDATVRMYQVSMCRYAGESENSGHSAHDVQEWQEIIL